MDGEKVMEIILEAQDEDIDTMIAQIMKRQKRLHPDWEGMYLSFPLRHPDECKRILETTWKILSEIMKDKSREGTCRGGMFMRGRQIFFGENTLNVIGTKILFLHI